MRRGTGRFSEFIESNHVLIASARPMRLGVTDEVRFTEYYRMQSWIDTLMTPGTEVQEDLKVIGSSLTSN